MVAELIDALGLEGVAPARWAITADRKLTLTQLRGRSQETPARSAELRAARGLSSAAGMNTLTLSIAIAIAALSLALGLTGCNGGVECANAACASPGSGGAGTGGSGNSGGSGGSGGSVDCSLEVPAPGPAFTFHVHNGGTATRTVNFGCGTLIPIALDTASGALPLGTGGDLVCDADGTCASAYKGDVIHFCSDCGPGVAQELPPGGTVDIAWNHIAYAGGVAPEACSGVPGGWACSLAVAVPGSTMQTGTITICADGAGFGGCFGESFSVSFTVDTTKAEGTIEVP